ncbi:MAG: 2-oxo acid dehydrogenase subunit E2, partial [Phycisphaerales bacterium]
MTDVTIPSPGESITEVRIGAWKRSDGDWVEKDELLNEIESDKATLELLAPAAGTLKVTAQSGSDQKVGAIVAKIDEKAKRPAGTPAVSSAPSGAATSTAKAAEAVEPKATSVAKKMAADKGVDIAKIEGTGPGGRVTKADVEHAGTPVSAAPSGAAASAPAKAAAPAAAPAFQFTGSRGVRRERMTKLRARIAERLVMAKNTAAMLTTFNECDMTEVMRLRAEHKESFEKRHGVGLGFMGFFMKAVVSALEKYPRVNASIVGEEIEYHDFVDVSVAVGTDKGLVVPVVRNAHAMSIAQVEQGIKELALKARDGKLTVDDMTGGTFTITNGGIYGSLMSTPIL